MSTIALPPLFPSTPSPASDHDLNYDRRTMLGGQRPAQLPA